METRRPHFGRKSLPKWTKTPWPTHTDQWGGAKHIWEPILAKEEEGKAGCIQQPKHIEYTSGQWHISQVWAQHSSNFQPITGTTRKWWIWAQNSLKQGSSVRKRQGYFTSQTFCKEKEDKIAKVFDPNNILRSKVQLQIPLDYSKSSNISQISIFLLKREISNHYFHCLLNAFLAYIDNKVKDLCIFLVWFWFSESISSLRNKGNISQIMLFTSKHIPSISEGVL